MLLLRRGRLLAISLCVLVLSATPAQCNDQKQLLLLIESYHSTFPWDVSYINAIQKLLGQRYRIADFSMDTKRLPPSQYQQRADLAWVTYLNMHPKLVFLADDNALRLLSARFKNTQTPVVYLGINNNPRQYGVYGAANMTGVLERPRMKDCIRMIRSVLNKPTMLKVLVLFDSGLTSQVVKQEVFEGKDSLVIDQVEVTLSLIGDWDAWQKRVLEAKQQGFDAVVVGLYHTLEDAQGHYVDSLDVLRWTSFNTPVPPFAFWDQTVGADKTIGGIVLDGRTQGEAAARIAQDILDGVAPASIPPQTVEQGTFMFSHQQVDKWNLQNNEFIQKHAELWVP